MERILIEALMIFVLRAVGIAVSTMATILTVQGRRIPAIMTGSLSTLIYVVALGRVVTNLDNLWNLAAYVVGFGVGTWLGMVLEQRMALGYAHARLISPDHGDKVATALREAGFGVTQLYGRGQEADVVIVETLIPRRCVSDVLEIAEAADDRVIAAVSEARTVQGGYWRRSNRR
jgi:uncharacterized protein YebE (UPF0316 family)